jgi:hypothetical protein
MKEKYIQIIGLFLTVIYAAFVVWLYAYEPKTVSEITSKAEVTIGTYQIGQAAFDEGLRLFYADNFPAARDKFNQADPEKRDAKAQFYIAYSFYRQGFGKLYDDDNLFKPGLETVNRVMALDANFKIDDSNLKMKTAAELKNELEKGLETSLDDLNPMKVLRERK